MKSSRFKGAPPRRKALALLLAAALAVLLAPTTLVALAGGQPDFVTVLAAIDRSKFKPEAVETLGGIVVYVADLAPVAVLRLPMLSPTSRTYELGKLESGPYEFVVRSAGSDVASIRFTVEGLAPLASSTLLVAAGVAAVAVAALILARRARLISPGGRE